MEANSYNSVSQLILFKDFCVLCNKIVQVPKQRKFEIVSKFIENWRNLEKNSKIDNNFFPAMRLLIPQWDRDRKAYGIKEDKLAKIYIRVLCLPKDGNDALKLLNYKAPQTAGDHAGDFADVAYWILKKRLGTEKNEKKLSIHDVNNALDNLARKNEEHDPRGIDTELAILVGAISAEEQKWLIRIVLKDLKLGISYGSVLEAFHPDAKDCYDVTNSLAEVCKTLKNPTIRLHEVPIKLYSPFAPMLCEELDVRSLDPLFNRSPDFFVETKMDGERFQIHMDNGKYRYYSRGAHEFTSNYGADASDGMLTPSLSKQILSEVSSLILDGEMMCWNTKSSKFTTKGYNIDVKKLNKGHVHRPCFCPFDVLYLNGEVLTNKPLINRLEILEKIIRPENGVISFVKRQRILKKEAVWDALNTAIDDCEEGIILKECRSVYKPHVRKGGGWYKIKPEYTDGLMHTVDLLIIGGYYGEGRCGGSITHFLLGVSADDKFWSAARVGCGYSMAELEKLLRRLQPHWQNVESGVIPDDIEWTKEKPDVWIQPRSSVILEIKASEIVPSNSYRTGCTLRFGRVIKVRYDKIWSDCTTLADFYQKQKNAGGKLTARHFSENDALSPPPQKRKTRTNYQIAAHFKITDASEVQVVSQLLQNKEICVMSDFQTMLKGDIERKIIKFGGKIVTVPGPATWLVLSEEENVRVKSVMTTKSHDIVLCSWLIPLLSHKTHQLPDIPRHAYLGLSMLTAARFMRHYDDFQDHYTVPATLESLKLSLDAAGKANLSPLSNEEQAEMDDLLFGGYNPFSVFRQVVAFSPETFEINLDESFKLRLAMIDFVMNGGQRTETLDNSVTHVILPYLDDYAQQLKQLRRQRGRKFHIVSPDWIQASITAKKPLDEISFAL